MRIYLPEIKVFTEAARPRLLLLLWVDKYFCLSKLKSIPVLLLDILAMNENVLLSLFVEFMFKLRTFLQVLANVIKIFQCSILYSEIYINSLNADFKIQS